LLYDEKNIREVQMKKYLLLTFVVLCLMIAGCAVPFRRTLDNYIMTGKYDLADKLIDKEKKDGSEYNDKSQLIYLFDKGSVTQMLGEYKISSDFLQQADDMIDKLYTKSAVDETYSFLSNDLALKYTGEDFEQVMVDILSALDYMYTGNFKDARIEVKKVNNKINLISDSYGDKAIYKDDAFARFISGFCYEANGEINDAYIDYKLSLREYEQYNKYYGTPVPEEAKEAVIRCARALNFRDDIQEFVKNYGDVSTMSESDLDKKSELLFVIYDGMPAYKVEGAYYMPVFIGRGYNLESVDAYAQGLTFTAFTAQDVSAMAVKNLQVRVGVILLKKAASGVVKELAKQIPILKYFVQEDKADTRSWRTIPARFDLIRMAVNPGKVKVGLVFTPTDTMVQNEMDFDYKLKPGEKKVVPVFCY
jgi:hypothetical protein